MLSLEASNFASYESAIHDVSGQEVRGQLQKYPAIFTASRYNFAMRFFVKAVATGFAMSMGSALFKKVSKKMGLDESEDAGKTAKAAEGVEDISEESEE